MTTPAGEDRLLDEVEAALQKASPGPWKRVRATAVLVGDGGGIPQTEENAELIAHAPDWLARLCARVRHLEAERDAMQRRAESAESDWQQSEAASQRLTEALQEIVASEECEIAVMGKDCLSEHLVAPCPHCRAKEALGAGAPPEDAR